MQVGVASRAKPGESECGDQVSVLRDAARWLVAVADGVGHGPAAALAARSAIASIAREPWIDLAAIIERCHREIASTRGVALAVVRLDAARCEIEHAAVGNVEVTGVTRERATWIAVPGIVGGRMRKLLVTRQRLHPGDVIVLHTDGISRRMDVAGHRELEATQAATRLLSAYASSHDDAACAFVRC